MTIVIIALMAALNLAEYRARLLSIDAQLGQGDRDGAARSAEALLHEEVRAGGEQLWPDATVLQPIADGDETARGPLRQLLAALPAGAQAAGAVSSDPLALEALRALQASAELRKGGKLPGAPSRKLSWLEQIKDWLGTGSEWLAARARDLWDWLKKWWPEEKSAARGDPKTASLNAVVFAMVGLMVVSVLALALRPLLQGQPHEPSQRARSPRDADEDPLARGAQEWEERARALLAAGRHREAIRAWYHAVLVASFRSGLLHHRRGRTNREYARSLPEVAVRDAFTELTARFDIEWYGRAESTREAHDDFVVRAQAVLGELSRRAA